MSNLNVEARDVIACLVIIGCFILLFYGIDGEVKAVLGAVIGYYFGLYTKSPREAKNGQTNSTGRSA